MQYCKVTHTSESCYIICINVSFVKLKIDWLMVLKVFEKYNIIDVDSLRRFDDETVK